MDVDMISDVKDITFDAIEKSKSLIELSNELRIQMKKNYPGKWQTFLYAHFGAFSIIKKSSTYIRMNI